MAGYCLDVTIDTGDATGALHRLAAAASDLSPAWDRIGLELVASTQQRFASGTDLQGRPWAALAPATVKQKLKSGKTKTLIHTGHLLGSIHFRRAPGDARGGGGVDIGSDRPYAAIHQFGGSITHHARSQPVYRRAKDVERGDARFVKRSQSDFMTYHEVGEHSSTIPARPFLGLDDQDHAQVLRVFSEHLS
ncbi:MAG: phage virion morphogenesis protein, partial [Alphaproteobacteria bacterium]|nr:phage virion morphogenesis protein [Alphaproteobacteria bacterium]